MGSDNLDVPLFKNQGAKYVQLALPNSIEKYDTSQRDVKDWLQDILLTLQNMPAAEFPVMIHCRAGRDRTGIVIATILTALGFPRDLISSTLSSLPPFLPIQVYNY
jgi:protein tyrosine/serine phosphatase